MTKTRTLTIASLLMAIGVILPQAFHSIPNIGNILLPMHIPVFITGFLCGPLYGILVGFLTPLLSHLLFSMPPAHVLSQMLIELATYGFVTGLLNIKIKKKKIINYYFILIVSMLIGRFTYGLFNALLFNVENYSLSIWLTTAFIKGLPGIIIQLLIIPALITSIKKMF